MIVRALAVWLLILLLAVLNGAVRDAWLTPRLGDTVGRGLSSVSLSFVVFLTTALTIPWIRPGSSREAWGIGVLWLGLTLAFEFVAGHYAFGRPWSELLSDYDVRRGRLWILVLVVTLLSPAWTARLRQVLER